MTRAWGVQSRSAASTSDLAKPSSLIASAVETSRGEQSYGQARCHVRFCSGRPPCQHHVGDIEELTRLLSSSASLGRRAQSRTALTSALDARRRRSIRLEPRRCTWSAAVPGFDLCPTAESIRCPDLAWLAAQADGLLRNSWLVRRTADEWAQARGRRVSVFSCGDVALLNPPCFGPLRRLLTP